jgi:hypothetical protein
MQLLALSRTLATSPLCSPITQSATIYVIQNYQHRAMTNQNEKKLQLPLLSTALVNNFEKKVINPALSNIHSTLITFKKSGVPFNLRYSFNYLKSVESITKNAVMLWFPLDNQLSSAELMHAVLQNLHTTYESELPAHAKKLLQQLLTNKNLQQTEFIAFIDLLLLDENIKFVFVFDDCEFLYNSYQPLPDTLAFVEQVCAHFNHSVGFIFITTGSFSKQSFQMEKSFWGLFQSNVIGGKEFLYDPDSIECGATAFSQKHNIKLKKEFINKITTFSLGDPAVVLYALYKAVSDNLFVQNVTSATEETIYSILDESYLDWRFGLLLSKMQESEIKALMSKSPSTPYVEQTGLISAKNNKVAYLNPLFQYFVENRVRQFLQPSTNSATNKQIPLKGQELLLFNLLTARTGEIVSKEKIAETIWGETWEQKYSDWALDKLISTLKKHIINLELPYTMQTFKKLGVMLVPLEQPSGTVPQNLQTF